MIDKWNIVQSLIVASAGLGGLFLGGYDDYTLENWVRFEQVHLGLSVNFKMSVRAR